IKVDREERPDVDSIYMQAVQMMTGHGGWPMSMFLTPVGKPFYAGTYFPPAERQGMPSFRRVLEHVAGVFRERRSDVEEASNEVQNALSSQLRTRRASDVNIDQHALEHAAASIARGYDPINGGFGSAPKFPPSMSLDFLMMVAHRTNDAQLREIVVNTLTKMARGGMYDQLGGGFHRYSVDSRWLVPHFEKMLYDNALLARLYTRAWQWTKEPLFAQIANEILGYVQREMTSPDGAFYSTLDADSEGEEGKFYVWTRDEVMEILGADDGRIFCALFDISDRGNWEGHNILNVPRPPEMVAADLGITLDQLADVASRGKCKLYGVRAKRVWPGRDEKLLAGWNGWMLAAFSEACIAFGRYEDVVRKNAEFLLTRIDASGRLTRHAKIPGLLEDYSGVAWGLTLAYEATFERKYLDAARTLADSILDRFNDSENGGFYDTPIDHEKLITRPKDLFDNATPSGTSVTCDVLLRLALLYGNDDYARAATDALESTWAIAEKYPSGFGFLLGVAEWRAGQPREIALTGSFAELKRVIGETYLPHRVLVGGEQSQELPLMQHRPIEMTRAYVCVGYACEEPTSDAERLREML
ncbi:MAG: thioredoxin domain-containing protein, partial [Thermoanaerobaculia bacterium]